MTSAPRFFARLAPWAAQQEGAVHAAVLPRFAPREAEQTADLEGQRQTPSIAGNDETTPRRADNPSRANRSRANPLDATIVKQIAPAIAAEQQRTRAPMPANTLAPSPVARRAPPVNTRADVPRTMRSLPTRAIAPESDASPPMHSTMVVDRVAALETHAEHEQPTTRADADLPAMAALGPLRPHAVAQRSAPARAEAPTIIEITIDRIDVRVPTSSTPTRPAATRAAPTQSLAEYLQPRGKGGA